MSFTKTDEAINIVLPQIPGLSTAPIAFSLPVSTLKTVIRLVVIISTYILFRPQVERVFRNALGQNDPAAPQSVESMKRQMKEFERDRGQPIGGGRKVAFATGAAGGDGQGQSQQARRKAQML